MSARSIPPRTRGPGRLVGLARAAMALVALVVLLVGVPLALSRAVGWPLPSGWPGLDEARLAVRDGLADTFWLKAFALLVWLAWVQLAFAVLAEIVALVRGRAAGPRLGFGWAEELAARLVGAVMVAASLFGQASHASAVSPPVAVQAAAVSVTATVVVEQPAAPALRSHLVVRGESLSSIAEDEFGSQAAWRSIWDANRDRSFGSRVFHDPNLILPGWDLALPGPPVAVAPEPLPTDVIDPAPVEAVVPVLIPPLVIRAADPPPAPVVAGDPAVPSGDPAVPSGDPAVPSGDPAVPSTHSAVPSTQSAVPSGDPADPSDEQAPAWARLGALIGAALLATGAISMVASSRRRALRAGTSASTVVPPDPQLSDAVTALTAGSEALAMARLELALRALAGRLGRAASDARPVALRRRADALEVVLDRPADVGGCWVPGSDPCHWELPAGVALTALVDDARAVAPPCPALVGIGRDGDGAECYLDLEAAGTLSIASGPSAASALRMLVATLAVTPLADGLRVLVVGPDVPGLRGRHDVHIVADAVGAIAEAEALTASIARVTAGAPSTFRLRTVAGHESWEPVVVVLSGPVPDDADLARLLHLAGSHRGVAVVGIDLSDAASQLVVGPDGLARLGPAGWPVRPHGLTEQDLAALDATLQAADHLLVEAHGPDPSGRDQWPVAPPSPAPHGPWPLMVRVLGPVDVVDATGQAASFERGKALELVVWLAQHASSPTRSGARAALWELDVSNASFSNIVSEARRGLARLVPRPDGEEWLARTYVERLPLHPGVVLDADLVANHLARARTLPDADAVVELREALALVRGAPYADRSYLWPDAEALPSTLTLLVTTVAAELGRRLLADGDAEGLFAATAVGLDVLPGHEELIALRLRAHALKGDRAALLREYASYEQAVLADPWDGEPAPALVALRRELLSPSLPVPVAGD